MMRPYRQIASTTPPDLDETASTAEEKATTAAQLEATTKMKAQTESTSLEEKEEAPAEVPAQTGSLEAKGEVESSQTVGGVRVD